MESGSASSSLLPASTLGSPSVFFFAFSSLVLVWLAVRLRVLGLLASQARQEKVMKGTTE